MMGSNIISLFTLAAVVTAQYVSEPYALHVTGKTNSSIDGYAESCHAGAAIEGLCYFSGTIDQLSSYGYYYLNATEPNGTQGLLVWELPLAGENGTDSFVPSALTLGPNYGSNVAVPLFYPGVGYDVGALYVSVFENGTLYLPGGPDDTANNDTYPVPTTYFGNLTNWNLCYQFTGGYYYYSIGWVFGTQPAQNPSCQPVDLTFEPVSSAEVTAYKQ